MKHLKAIAVLILIAALLCGCAGMETERAAEETHIIGVAIYNAADDEVRMFRDYLENYIGNCFEDIRFLYSDSITAEEELLSFVDTCAQEGAEGILSFVSYDLKAETDFCADNKMYYLRCAGTVDNEQFEAAADNPYFLGEIGPGAALETQTGEEVTRTLLQNGQYRSLLIFSGGSAMGNEMHRLRTVAILEALQQSGGASFSEDPTVLAAVDRTVTVQAGDISVTICPGYISREPYCQTAIDIISGGSFDAMLSVLSVASLRDTLRSAKLPYGVVDCFSEENSLAFQSGELVCIAGKYRSEVGPCFTAMYNAITGNADAFRDNGKAFRMEQGFWTAHSREEYTEMYGLSCGSAVNAYSYEDLCSVIKASAPEADFNTFKTLVSAYSYEDCLARRQG